MQKKFDFNDILLIPKVTTEINSRKEVNPFTNNSQFILPLMTAPMDTIIDNFDNFDKNNIKKIQGFISNGINLCLPRGLSNKTIDIINDLRNDFVNYNQKFNQHLTFQSLSLKEFDKRFLDYKNIKELKHKQYICIDIANGHMKSLLNSITNAKRLHGDNLIIMAGNIGNPETYKFFANIETDYIRAGIGTGSICTTSKNVAIGYPLASLVKEIYEIKKKNGYQTKIVADGGMKDFSDIIKVLALGADYVISGNIFNKSLESFPTPYLFNKIPIKSYELSKFLLKNKFPLYKKYYGMSTKIVQRKWGKEELRTSEGVVRTKRVEYTLDTWVENFQDYLRSAMSYTNSRTLEDFKESEYVFITENAYKRFDK